jgi:hypothetical protein
MQLVDAKLDSPAPDLSSHFREENYGNLAVLASANRDSYAAIEAFCKTASTAFSEFQSLSMERVEPGRRLWFPPGSGHINLLGAGSDQRSVASLSAGAEAEMKTEDPEVRGKQGMLHLHKIGR